MLVTFPMFSSNSSGGPFWPLFLSLPPWLFYVFKCKPSNWVPSCNSCININAFLKNLFWLHQVLACSTQVELWHPGSLARDWTLCTGRWNLSHWTTGPINAFQHKVNTFRYTTSLCPFWSLVYHTPTSSLPHNGCVTVSKLGIPQENTPKDKGSSKWCKRVRRVIGKGGTL